MSPKPVSALEPLGSEFSRKEDPGPGLQLGQFGETYRERRTDHPDLGIFPVLVAQLAVQVETGEDRPVPLRFLGAGGCRGRPGFPPPPEPPGEPPTTPINTSRTSRPPCCSRSSPTPAGEPVSAFQDTQTPRSFKGNFRPWFHHPSPKRNTTSRRRHRGRSPARPP